MKVPFFTMVSIPVSIRSVSGQYPITSGAMDCLTHCFGGESPILSRTQSIRL